MLLEVLIRLVFTLIDFIFAVLPEIPAFPTGISDSINTFFDLILVNGLSLFGLFVRIKTVVIVIPLVLILMKLELIFSFIIWLVKKIPFIGIK